MPNSRRRIQLPAAKKDIGGKCLTTLARRLWLDWKENKGPTLCWVVDGMPSDDGSRPSEAPFRLAYDGYGDNQYGWAKQCWEEMFGNPSRNTNDGVQALLAICEGRIHRDLKKPKGPTGAGPLRLRSGRPSRAIFRGGSGRGKARTAQRIEATEFATGLTRQA